MNGGACFPATVISVLAGTLVELIMWWKVRRRAQRGCEADGSNDMFPGFAGCVMNAECAYKDWEGYVECVR